jgi:hypothetical protein
LNGLGNRLENYVVDPFIPGPGALLCSPLAIIPTVLSSVSPWAQLQVPLLTLKLKIMPYLWKICLFPQSLPVLLVLLPHHSLGFPDCALFASTSIDGAGVA